MAWSLVAKVEYMVVEMVEKVVVEMGYLVEKKRKKKVVWWCCGCCCCWNGGEKGRVVGGGDGGGNGGGVVVHGRPIGRQGLPLLSGNENKGRRMKIMKEREGVGVFIKGRKIL